MSNITKAQKQALAAILRRQDLFDDRSAIYSEHTGRNITSTGQLTQREAHELIKSLSPTRTGQPNWRPGQTMRRAIISAAKEMGWITPEGKPDMQSLHGWLVKYGMYHKPLNDLDPSELAKTLTQIRKARDSYFTRASSPQKEH